MFISDAYAQAAGAPAGAGGGMSSLLIMGLMFAVLWFLMIRPQMKRAKEHRNLLEALAKGDEVVTQGGLVGKITQIQDAFVKVAVADNVEVTVQKPSIAAVLPKGTLKNT